MSQARNNRIHPGSRISALLQNGNDNDGNGFAPGGNPFDDRAPWAVPEPLVPPSQSTGNARSIRFLPSFRSRGRDLSSGLRPSIPENPFVDNGEDYNSEASENALQDEEWDMVDEAYPNHGGRRPAASISTGVSMSSPQEDVEMSDAEDAVNISDSAVVDWNNSPFDFAVPFDRPILQEQYPFEMQHPHVADMIRQVRNLSAMGSHAMGSARSLRRRVVRTYRGASRHLNRAMHAGRHMAATAGQTGAVVAGQVYRTGQELTRMAFQQIRRNSAGGPFGDEMALINSRSSGPSSAPNGPTRRRRSQR